MNKNKNNNSLFLFLIFIVTLIFEGCSFFTKKVEALSSNSIGINSTQSPETLRCQNKSFQILIDNESAHNPLEDFLNKKTFLNKSFIDKSILLTLIELTRRPDAISPNSRWQVFIRYNGKEHYYDFRPKDLNNRNNFSLFYGLDFISKQFQSNKIEQLISEFDSSTPQNISVDISLENFLNSNKKEIDKNEMLKNIFFKGDELITHFESFKRINLSPIYRSYLKNNLNDSNLYEIDKNQLNDKITEKNYQLACNFDFKSEIENKTEISSIKDERTHYLGLKDNDNFFIAVASSSLIRPLTTQNNSYLIKMKANPLPLASCYMKSDEIKGLYLSSIEGKSKSQHLKHLIDYDIFYSKSLTEIKDILKFSRHLFLSNPDRILYESKRGRKDQIEFFLTMKFPIYHVEQLGNVIGFASLRKENSLILDDRTKAEIWCTE